MKLIEKTKEKIIFEAKIDVSLANALRRSVNEIPVLAFEEVDFYRNDSALYDEILAHRVGLIPLKNQKLKKGEKFELKLKAKGAEGGKEVLAGDFGEEVVYPETPLVLLDEGQEIELVARAESGIGKDHAKFAPGLFFYRHKPKITLNGDGEKQSELAELYPEVFAFDDKLSVKDEWKLELDSEDLKDYKGVSVEFDDTLVFIIESWGQMDAKDIFVESCKALKSNLDDVAKALK